MELLAGLAIGYLVGKSRRAAGRLSEDDELVRPDLSGPGDLMDVGDKIPLDDDEPLDDELVDEVLEDD